MPWQCSLPLSLNKYIQSLVRIAVQLDWGSAMASHFSSIGFKIEEFEDVVPLADKVVLHNQKYESGGGLYWQWPVGDGVELWLHTSRKKEFYTIVPHFAGKESGRVRITAPVPGDPAVPLVGGYHAWANPDSSPDGTEFPFIFEAPDPHRFSGYVGEIVPVQITAFAHEIQHLTPEEYEAQDQELKLAKRSFIPSGLFGEKDKDLTQKAMGLFTGEVSNAEKKTNAETQTPFWHVRVATLELEFDVVADQSEFSDAPKPGDILQVSGWLSGRILASPKEKPKGLFSRFLRRR